MYYVDQNFKAECRFTCQIVDRSMCTFSIGFLLVKAVSGEKTTWKAQW